MCHIIDSENVLLNYFLKSDSDEISFKELREIRKIIEEKLDDTVYLDISLGSIKNTVDLHRDLFKLYLTKVQCIKEKINEETEESIELTNINLPADIQEKYMEAMTEFVQG